MAKHAARLFLARSLDRLVLRYFGLNLRPLPHPTPPIEPWWIDEDFLLLWKRIETRTLVERQSAYLLWQLSAHVSKLEGDIAEVGSYRGGSAYLLAASTKRLVHIFDTFEGMPETDPERDIFRKGDFGDTSYDEVRDFLKDLRNVKIHRGLFPDSAGPIIDKRFCLVHIDVDIYRSVLDCCRFFYPRLVLGGCLVFDDYGYPKCPGAKLAVDEFFRDRPETPLYYPNGQSIVVRLPE